MSKTAEGAARANEMEVVVRSSSSNQSKSARTVDGSLSVIGTVPSAVRVKMITVECTSSSSDLQCLR